MNNLLKFSLAYVFLFLPGLMIAQTGDLKLLDWRPVSQMVVKENKILKPKYPVIDIHNHLRDLDNVGKYLEEMSRRLRI